MLTGAHGFALLDEPLQGDPTKQKLVPPVLLTASELHTPSISTRVARSHAIGQVNRV